MKDLKTIQDIVNAKAKKRAEEEVNKIIKAIYNNNDIHNMLDNYYIKVGDKTESIRSAFWSKDSSIAKELIEKLTIIYIPIESENFINKVNQLSSELEDLKNYNYDNSN